MSSRTLKINPDNFTATWEDIRRERDILREAPITLDDGRTFDADQDSFALFGDAIDEYDSLPTLDASGNMLWKMTNNQYTSCTKADLISILAEMKTKRAVRAALLQVQAETFAASPPKVKDLKNTANWDI